MKVSKLALQLTSMCPPKHVTGNNVILHQALLVIKIFRDLLLCFRILSASGATYNQNICLLSVSNVEIKYKSQQNLKIPGNKSRCICSTYVDIQNPLCKQLSTYIFETMCNLDHFKCDTQEPPSAARQLEVYISQQLIVNRQCVGVTADLCTTKLSELLCSFCDWLSFLNCNPRRVRSLSLVIIPGQRLIIIIIIHFI